MRRWKIARQMQYESITACTEVLPLMQQMNWSPKRIAMGCSFGGYHAANMTLRHPGRFRDFLSMGGAFRYDEFSCGAIMTRTCTSTSRCNIEHTVHDWALAGAVQGASRNLRAWHGRVGYLPGVQRDMARVFRDKGIPVPAGCVGRALEA